MTLEGDDLLGQQELVGSYITVEYDTHFLKNCLVLIHVLREVGFHLSPSHP